METQKKYRVEGRERTSTRYDEVILCLTLSSCCTVSGWMNDSVTAEGVLEDSMD